MDATERAIACDLDGHRWHIDRYTDALNTRTGQVVMAAWAHLRCDRCNTTTTVWNPGA
jgi:hypothetical protein